MTFARSSFFPSFVPFKAASLMLAAALVLVVGSNLTIGQETEATSPPPAPLDLDELFGGEVVLADENDAEMGLFDQMNKQLEPVDQGFGEYVVKPLGSVIFNGFWTKDWLGTHVPFIVAWLLVGAVFFTIYMGFINIRGFWHAIRLTKGDYDDPNDEGEVSHFQALSSALSGTVGLGNIAGVAIAIAQGGPGATFWMILVGLLGMSTKFTECTLGQMYRTTDSKGRVSGGPMRYLSHGFRERGWGPIGSILAVMFALLCIGGSFGGGSTFQVSQSLDAIKTEIPFLNEYNWLYGILMATAVGLVIVGGIKSIGKVAGRIVPIMCLGYVICAVYILIANAAQIPDAFSQIIDGAFNTKAIYGGFLGCLVIGIKRAVFSNEAGTGSASIAHSAAKTDVPVREGYVALLEPLIDTVVVCTMTALVIIITGVVSEPDRPLPLETLRQELAIVDNVPENLMELTADEAALVLLSQNKALDKNGDNYLTVQDMIDLDRGAYFTKEAFATGGHAFFKWFLYAAVVLFAYSTCISWYYYGERCFTALLGDWSSLLYKVLFLAAIFLGSVISATNIKDFSDMMILGMAFPNMLGMYFLSSNVKEQLFEYIQGLRSGRYRPVDQSSD